MRVGLFVFAALIIVVVAIFVVTGGNILGPKYKLITYLPEVEGVQAGAPVDLDGVQIGSVQSVELTPHPSDRMHGIKLILRIDKKYQEEIRTDSSASLVTQGLLGDRYVTISRGLTGSVLPDNGIVPGGEEEAMRQIEERGAALMENLSTLSVSLRGIVDQIQKGDGTIGKLINDPDLYDHLNETAAKIDAMATSIQQGQGSAGKLIASDELYQKVDDAVGKADDVLGAVRDQKGSMGKLIYDPSAYDSIKNFAASGNALLTDVRAGKGTLGKLVTDDTLYANVRDATANVRDATAKLNSNQGTMGKFFTDPAFYDNVTGLTGDLRLLVGDFRQNPKKFLHIKIGLF